MNAVTVSEAKRNLEQMIDRVIADAEPTIVVTESGQQVVVLALDEYGLCELGVVQFDNNLRS